MYNPEFLKRVYEKRNLGKGEVLQPKMPPVEDRSPQYHRRARLIAAHRIERQRIERETARLTESIRQANEAIRKANEAARRFNDVTDDANRIIKRICRATGVSRHDIIADRRDVHLVLARQACCYWIARLTGLSLPRIGRMIGGRDHTTVLHAKRVYVEKRAKMGRTLRPVR